MLFHGLMESELSDPPIDSMDPYTFKVQKYSKEIGKIIHCDIRGSTSNFMKLREYFWRVSTEHKQRMLFCEQLCLI